MIIIIIITVMPKYLMMAMLSVEDLLECRVVIVMKYCTIECISLWILEGL